ncbi:MAG TPA: imelysin family protein, partial [Candidatus Krumholzibacteria bacterium]|nr:imelysin family protein [Candidatus Krumholzibacteria bacterium]
MAAVLIAGACACSSDDSTVAPSEPYDFSPILSDYSNHVVLATYANLRDESAALVEAIEALDAAPADQAMLDAVADAWRAARAPWESSDAFRFGPAESIQASLDSWPVDRLQIDAVLASESDLTPEFVRSLGPGLRGFHTIEYLLFRDGETRGTTTMTERERDYLAAAARLLLDDVTLLHGEWASGFAQDFARAGKQHSPYPTQADAATEIVDGIIAALDRLANVKLADPVVQQNVELVQSQFSWNSLRDFEDNLHGARDAYLGTGSSGTDARGIDEFVKSKDEALNWRVRAQLTEALDLLATIPAPFEQHLSAG